MRRVCEGGTVYIVIICTCTGTVGYSHVIATCLAFCSLLCHLYKGVVSSATCTGTVVQVLLHSYIVFTNHRT